MYTFSVKILKVHKALYTCTLFQSKFDKFTSLVHFFSQNSTSSHGYSLVHFFSQNPTSSQCYRIVNFFSQNLTNSQGCTLFQQKFDITCTQGLVTFSATFSNKVLHYTNLKCTGVAVASNHF